MQAARDSPWRDPSDAIPCHGEENHTREKLLPNVILYFLSARKICTEVGHTSFKPETS